MLIAARNGFMVGGWRNPYVTDGLVAMWDGEWNAGGGKHDPNATVWKDLCNNGYDAAILRDVVVGETYCSTPGGSPLYAICKTEKWADDVITIEAVGSIPDVSKEVCFCGGNVNHANTISDDIKGIAIGNNAIWTGKIRRAHYGINGFQLENNKIYSISSAWSADGSVSVNGSSFAKTTNPAAYFNAGGPVSIFGTGYNLYAYNASTVYCVRLYNRALTAAEIAANYAVDRARFNLP